MASILPNSRVGLPSRLTVTSNTSGFESVDAPSVLFGAKKPAKRQKYSGNTAEDQMAKGFLMLLSLAIGAVGIATTGAVKVVSAMAGPRAESTLISNGLDRVANAKALPTQQREAFVNFLKELQVEVAQGAKSPDAKVLLDIIPTLTPEEMAKVDGLLAKANKASTPAELNPLFDEWLQVLKQHVPEAQRDSLDVSGVQKDAAAFFRGVTFYNNLQSVFTFGLIASALVFVSPVVTCRPSR